MSKDPKDFYPDDMEFITEEELARSEGFYIDDDGHWVPMDDDEFSDYPCYDEIDEDVDWF